MTPPDEIGGMRLKACHRELWDRLFKAGVSKQAMTNAVWRAMIDDGTAQPLVQHGLNEQERAIWRYCGGGERAKAALLDFKNYGVMPDGCREWIAGGCVGPKAIDSDAPQTGRPIGDAKEWLDAQLEKIKQRWK